MSGDPSEAASAQTQVGPSGATTGVTAPRPEPPGLGRGTPIGRFLVLERLGAGGMGMVLSAYDPQLDRKVAIKIVRPGVSASETIGSVRSRLHREAQAMAKLSHPNVITVFEVGAHGDDIFVAMELVDGSTLTSWFRRERRSWRQVVDMMLAAGSGLAAAHKAGLVHRDFKPDNVLVGRDGAVRVTDFGLVGNLGGGDPLTETMPAAPSTPIAVSGSLTKTGAIMGTPAYMAPEQYGGQTVDERADQFAFCVTLYEGLCGQRPFAGDNHLDLMLNVRDGKVLPFPREAKVPGWIRAIVLRGLSVDPRNRFASMEQLLEALRKDPAVWRRRALLVGGGALLVAGLAALALTRGAADPCEGSRERLAGIWDEGVKQTLEATFRRVGGNLAAPAWERVGPALDAYADRWVAGHTEACRATAVRHEQSERLLDLRMRCLDRRRVELAALTSLMGRADLELVAKSSQAAYGLPPPEGCSDLDALDAAYPPPDKAGLVARVAELRLRLADVAALQASGKWKEAGPAAETLLAEVRPVDYPSLVAETLFLVGTLRRDLKDGRGAEKALLELTTVGARAREDVLVARAWTELVFSVGFLQGKPAEGLAYEAPARSMLVRAGQPPAQVEARLETVLSVAHGKAARGEEAKHHAERALEILSRAFPDGHPDIAHALHNLCLAGRTMARVREGMASCERAIAMREKLLGKHHPLYAASLQTQATMLSDLGRHEEALALGTEVLAIQERALGAEAQEVAVTLSNMAGSLTNLGRLEEAVALLERALPIKLKVSGPDNPSTAYTLMALGDAKLAMNQCDDATVHHERALAIFVEAGGDPIQQVRLLAQLATCARKQGRNEDARARLDQAVAVGEKAGEAATALADALTWRAQDARGEKRYADAVRDLRRAVALREKSSGPDAASLQWPLQQLAEALLGQGAAAEAVPVAERTLAIAEKEQSAVDVAYSKYLLARALWDSDAAKRPHARELATASRAGYAALGDAQKASVTELDDWLAKHPGE